MYREACLMTPEQRTDSVHLFFETFSNHLKRIRDEGKDANQAYRAQILIGQLHQFEKAINEYHGFFLEDQAEEKVLRALLAASDLGGLLDWIATDQNLIPIAGVFYLNSLSQWECQFGNQPMPKNLRIGEWLERGKIGRLSENPSSCLIYVFGEPRILLLVDQTKEWQIDELYSLLRLLARLCPLFITSPIKQTVPKSDLQMAMVAHDANFLEVLNLIERVAKKDVTILLEGESGTGKEVVANFIYRNSSRANKPFVAVNCAAIPAGLIESELFGHEKGAFTGAHQRKIGRVEEARGGTLFLDEIGEIELAMQAKILRFIQLRELHRVGGRQKISVDVRIIAATNRDLKKRVAEGHFREDLYYRLSVAPFTIPPLRERVDDIVPLTRFFLEKYCESFKIDQPKVDESVFRALACYNFPGNVRELENMVQKILVLSQGETIRLSHLPKALQEAEPKGTPVVGPNGQTRTWKKHHHTKKYLPNPLKKMMAMASGPVSKQTWNDTIPQNQ